MTKASAPKTSAGPDVTVRPSPQATRLFTRLMIGFAILYGLWAAVLSFRIVVQQQAVRRHLDFALRTRPRRTFPTRTAAWTIAQDFVARLNAAFPTNPCSASAAFAVARGPHIRIHDCQIVVIVTHRRLHVQGYDTQGHRMDNVFERLHPPPRRL